MRYTRYEYKRYEKVKFLLSVIIITVLSISGGLCAGNFIFNKTIKTQNVLNQSRKEDELSELNLVALQCGYYGNEDNAKKSLVQIKSYTPCFIVNDKGKYRLIAGIYKENEIQKKINELNKNKIETSKIRIKLTSSNEEEIKLIEVINGSLTIMDKLSESDVQSIKSADFKKWSKNIIGDKNKIKSDKLKQVYENINNLPEDMTSENSENFYSFIYTVINEE